MFLFPSLLPNGWRDEVRYGVLEEDGEEPSLCNIALRYPNRRNRDTNHDVAYSFTPFSRRQGAADAPVFTSFRNQDKQFVLCHFVIFIVIDIFRAIKIQIQNNQSQQVDPCPLDQPPVSRVFQRFHVLSCTHDTKSRCWTSGLVVHVRPQEQWVAEPQSLHHQCLHIILFSIGHDLELCFGAIAEEGSCEPYPRSPSDVPTTATLPLL